MSDLGPHRPAPSPASLPARPPDGWGPPDRSALRPVEGGVTAPEGFTAGGTHAGLKPSGRADLALLAVDGEATGAVVTTSNLVKAPACRVSERHAADGDVRAVVANSGNANVCTPDGMAHAEETARVTGRALGIPAETVLVLSTGVIGVPLDVEVLTGAIPDLAAGLSPDGGAAAAQAIMTTDSVPKQVAYRVADGQGSCVVAGMAKGVGMMAPSMATLLAVVTTDAPVTRTVLRQVLIDSARSTFNRITVDGEQSTNDTVALLANGRVRRPPGLTALTTGVRAVCADLAHQIVADGEGATKVAAVTVRSAPTGETAERLAHAVATSPLVRAALHGADPNWGRIMAAMGAAGVTFEPERVSIACGGLTVCRYGVATSFDRGRVSAVMGRDTVPVDVDLGMGGASATVLTCDLSPEYVRFNSAYTT